MTKTFKLMLIAIVFFAPQPSVAEEDACQQLKTAMQNVKSEASMLNSKYPDLVSWVRDMNKRAAKCSNNCESEMAEYLFQCNIIAAKGSCDYVTKKLNEFYHRKVEINELADKRGCVLFWESQ